MTEIDNDTAKKVLDLLSDPEMMKKISAIASSTIQTQGIEEQSRDITASYSKEGLSEPQSSLAVFNNKNSKADLLLAVKPLLKKEKQGKIDAIIKALSVATTLSKLKGGVNV